MNNIDIYYVGISGMFILTNILILLFQDNWKKQIYNIGLLDAYKYPLFYYTIISILYGYILSTTYNYCIFGILLYLGFIGKIFSKERSFELEFSVPYFIYKTVIHLLLFVSILTNTSKELVIKVHTKQVKIDSFTEYNLYKEILKDSILYPDIILKQAKLETGNFTSNVFKTRNNLFGFRLGNGYLKFDNWKQSVEYMAKWQKRRYNKGENYYSFLKRIGYATDSSYCDKLKSIK